MREYKSDIICPHCNEILDDWEDFGIDDEYGHCYDDYAKKECSKCNKEFYVEIIYIEEYKTSKIPFKPSTCY